MTIGKPMEINNIQTMLLSISTAAIYSFSILEVVTLCCILDLHKVGSPKKVNNENTYTMTSIFIERKCCITKYIHMLHDQAWILQNMIL